MTRPAAIPATTAPPAKRMTLSEVVERLLERGAGASSSVSLTRNAKGDTQIEVVVRTGTDDAIVTIADAEAEACAVYDRLRAKYPMHTAPSGTGGAA